MRNGVWRIDGSGANAVEGQVVWSPVKSLWNTFMLGGALALAPLHFSWGAFGFFLIFTYLSMLFGHSIGMHRRLIHRTFECAKPFERFLVWIGVLVGMAGPFGILRIHDVRDWAQRQVECHDFFAHRRGLVLDAFWQLHCAFKFKHAPSFQVEQDLADDPWYKIMEKTWMLQQIALGGLLYAWGGMSWLAWGMFARVAVSVSSHWIVTYYAHNPGSGRWRVKDAAVQAANLPTIAFLTHGECWHNNHHAFPESAQMGLEPGELDTGWALLKYFAQRGWVWNLQQPRPEDRREDLQSEPGFYLSSGHEVA